MSKNFYNEEESQFQELRAVLKELPKIKAEDNFEFNLMTRIHNKQFGSKLLKNEKYTFFGFLKPALAVSVIALLVFVVTQNQTTEIENPFTSMPKIRSEIVNNNKAGEIPKEFVIADKSGIQDNLTDSESAEPEVSERRLIVQENDVITVAHEDFPFPDQSFDLDSRLRDGNPNLLRGDNRVLAGAGSASRSSNKIYFEGFYTGNKSAKKTIDSLKNESFRESDTSKQKSSTNKRK